MTTIDSLTFDLSDCTLKQKEDNLRGWLDSKKNIGHLLRFNSDAPDWTFDLTDLEGATKFYRQQCQDNAGAMLSLDLVTADGVECLCALFKYRAPANKLAMLYAGILWIPFRDCTFQINVEAMETGTTGTREVAIMLSEKDGWPSQPDKPPIKVKDASELFERMGSAPVIKLPSDDERFDSMFADHPLTKVRARLNQVIATLKLDPETRALKPFRVSCPSK